MKKYYCIEIGGNEEIAEKVVTTLLSKGYVFGPMSRYRTWQEVKNDYWGVSCNWVLINFDSICKRVLMWGFGKWDEETDFAKITLEECLDLIDKGIVCL